MREAGLAIESATGPITDRDDCRALVAEIIARPSRLTVPAADVDAGCCLEPDRRAVQRRSIANSSKGASDVPADRQTVGPREGSSGRRMPGPRTSRPPGGGQDLVLFVVAYRPGLRARLGRQCRDIRPLAIAPYRRLLIGQGTAFIGSMLTQAR